jgi:hypothetical protein
MLSRARSSDTAVDVEIEMLGEVNALGLDLDLLTQWIDWRAADYRNEAAPKRTSHTGIAAFAG